MLQTLHHDIAPIWIGPRGTEAGIRSLRAQDPLFFEGDDAGSLYEVIEGVLRVCKVFSDGRRQIISFAFPGDLIGFGQTDVFSFDCDALTYARVRAIPKSSLLRTALERSELGEKLLAIAANEVNSVQNLSILLCRKSAIERVASFLVYLSKRLGEEAKIVMPMTRADIADYLGLTIETVSRNITKLRGMGVISLPGSGSISIRDMRQLCQIAECDGAMH